MSNDQEASIVMDILTKDMGFETRRIPEQDSEKRADIWARKGEDYFLFEVKYVETKYKIKINTISQMKSIGGVVKLPH